MNRNVAVGAKAAHGGAEGLGRVACELATHLAIPGLIAGFFGGIAMIVLMILDMGASGMGYATPLSVGIASFVYTITPPMSMLPMLMKMMGGHATPAVMAAMQTLQSGHATNSTVATLMGAMDAGTRNQVMVAMPVTAAHVAVGIILHFAFAAFVGVVFAGLLALGAWLRVPLLRTSAGIIAGSVIGGALLYVVMRWGILPSTAPLMAFVPQVAFFFAHVLYGLVVGIVLVAARKLQHQQVTF